FLFFSSRGRHTRFSRDWSSDVCSSDLTCFGLLDACPVRRQRRTGGRNQGGMGGHAHSSLAASDIEAVSHMVCSGRCYPSPMSKRSEERRVGKESRLRR